MALIYKDRVRQKTRPVGTGPATLLAGVGSYFLFSQANLGNNSFPYAIINNSQFEVGIGTYSNGVVYRNIVLSNSNGPSDTNLVNFNGALADIIITNPAELSVLTSTQPEANTNKFVKWVNNEFLLDDPVENATSLGTSIQSSVIYYNQSTASFAADPRLKYNTGTQSELFLDGVFQATAKSFKIPHPAQENKYLVHGCLEGPEHGIYIRGTIKTKHKTVIALPKYFLALGYNYTVIFSKNSFMPITLIKGLEKFTFKTMIPSLKEIEIDYIIIGTRNDIKLEVEQDVR